MLKALKEESTIVIISQGGPSVIENRPVIKQLGSSLWSWITESLVGYHGCSRHRTNIFLYQEYVKAFQKLFFWKS